MCMCAVKKQMDTFLKSKNCSQMLKQPSKEMQWGTENVIREKQKRERISRKEKNNFMSFKVS